MFNFEPVRIDSRVGDDDARLVFAQGRLLAVLVRLSLLHGELEGRWFLEAAFNPFLPQPDGPFATTEDFEAWVNKSVGEI